MSSKVTEQQPTKLIGVDDVIVTTSLSKASVYRLMKAGRFPQARKLIPGGRRVAWAESEVLAWVRSPLDWHAPVNF